MLITDFFLSIYKARKHFMNMNSSTYKCSFFLKKENSAGILTCTLYSVNILKAKPCSSFPLIAFCFLFFYKLSVSNRAHQINDSHHNTEKMFAHVTKQLRLLKPAV